MPIGLDKAPKTLPGPAKNLWVGTFNGVFDACDGPEAECDQRAAKIAWDAIKQKYRKVGEQWVAKSETDSEAYHDVLLTITKASLQADGSVRWQAVASDTGPDKSNERTSIELFQDWIDRVTYKAKMGYLPEPAMPFLGVSHYPVLDGYGQAGTTRRMYIDGNVFKADGIFNAANPVGLKLLDAVKSELAIIKKGNVVEKPIRISAGWWDLQHYHDDSDYTFTRQSLADKCPICEKGQTDDKNYRAGQLDHFAATRVPMNTRTSLELEVKSMSKITRRDDATSIIGSDEADEMERRATLVGKSDTGHDSAAMVTKAATEIGDFIKNRREKAEMSIADLAAETPATGKVLGDIEAGDQMPSKAVIAAIAKVLNADEQTMLDLLPGQDEADIEAETSKAKHGDDEDDKDKSAGRFFRNFRRKKKMELADVAKRMKIKPSRLRLFEDDEDDDEPEFMANLATALKIDADEKDELLARFGKKRRKTPPVRKSAMVHENEYGQSMPAMMVMPPLGGATSIGEANEFIKTKEKLNKMDSHWDVFEQVVGNIMTDEAVTDKVAAMSKAVNDLGSQINTLKAGLSDAFLIQESETGSYEDGYEDGDHPADQLKSLVDAALADHSISRSDRETAVQDAFNNYAETVKSELDQAGPVTQADQAGQIGVAVKDALEGVLGPLAEQVGLLTAKMNQMNTPASTDQPLQQVYMPQQKSFVAPAIAPQPVTGQNDKGLPISPHTGEPSALTAMVRKGVGIRQDGIA